MKMMFKALLVAGMTLSVGADAAVNIFKANIETVYLNGDGYPSITLKNFEFWNATSQKWVPNSGILFKSKAPGLFNYHFVTGQTNTEVRRTELSMMLSAATSGTKVQLGFDEATKCETTWMTCDISGSTGGGIRLLY